MTPKIYGTTTLNEKGQAVIPSEARSVLGLKAASKLLVMGSPDGKALILVPTEQAEQMLEGIASMAAAIRSSQEEETSE